MKRDCERVERIVRVWEEQGTLPASDHELIKAHCATCTACSRRYTMLLAFLQRDARGTSAAGAEEPGPAFIEKVMQRIGTAVPRKRLPPFAWAALAAACLLIFAGIGSASLWLRSAQRADEVLVHFELVAPGARSVALVGNFAGWDTTKYLMTDANRDGVWQISVRLKKGSLNIYNFVIDGSQWVSDPKSPTQVDDGFGGTSSVLRL